MTASAIAIRSKSMGTSKHIFNMKRKTREEKISNYSSQDRSASVSSRSKLTKGGRRKKNGEGGIIEQVEEEDKMSADYDSGEDEAFIR